MEKEYEPFAMVTNKDRPTVWTKDASHEFLVAKGLPDIGDNECIGVYGSYASSNSPSKVLYYKTKHEDGRDYWISASDLDDTNECNEEDGKKKEQTRRQKKRKPTTSKRPRRSNRLAGKKRKSKRV